MDMKAFLCENAVPDENIKFAASKRFLDDSGKPVEWEVCGITSKEDEDIRSGCMRKVPIPGKKNQYTTDIDFNKYLGLLAARCTVYPNLNNAELQDSYGVKGADALLKAMLKPGEYAEYLKKIQEINGFDVTIEEEVEEAKN